MTKKGKEGHSKTLWGMGGIFVRPPTWAGHPPQIVLALVVVGRMWAGPL